MNRPIFLTRTQRMLPVARRVLAAVVVFGLFAGIGIVIGGSL